MRTQTITQADLDQAIAEMRLQRFTEESETTIRIGRDGVVHIWSNTSDVTKILRRLAPEDVRLLTRTPGERPGYLIEVNPDRYRHPGHLFRPMPSRTARASEDEADEE